MSATQNPALIFLSGNSKNPPTYFRWPCMNAVLGCQYTNPNTRLLRLHQETYSLEALEKKHGCSNPVRLPASLYLTYDAVPISVARTVVRIQISMALTKGINCVGWQDPSKTSKRLPTKLERHRQEVMETLYRERTPVALLWECRSVLSVYNKAASAVCGHDRYSNLIWKLF